MLNLVLRDLQYRKRQFAIAIIGAGLVFALALLLTGVRGGFDTEATATVEAAGADGWIVKEGVSGPFTSISVLPTRTVGAVLADGGVTDAAPFLASPNRLRPPGATENIGVNVIGVEPGALGAPVPDEGEALTAPGQVVVDKRADASIGEQVTIGGREYEVAGLLSNRTYFGGIPVAYMTLSDAQELIFDGAPLANAIIFTGNLTNPLPGTTVLSDEVVESDMKVGLAGAIGTIDLLRVMMWIVAAVIIGAVVYLSALERTTDFAVLKAVGSGSWSLAIGLSIQAILVSLLAAVLGVIIATALTPGFPAPTSIDVWAYVTLFAIAALVGALASLAALRRVLKVDPARAFG